MSEGGRLRVIVWVGWWLRAAGPRMHACLLTHGSALPPMCGSVRDRAPVCVCACVCVRVRARWCPSGRFLCVCVCVQRGWMRGICPRVPAQARAHALTSASVLATPGCAPCGCMPAQSSGRVGPILCGFRPCPAGAARVLQCVGLPAVGNSSLLRLGHGYRSSCGLMDKAPLP